ncbi:MAG: TRAP transporter substrate-binding protein [Pseudomonadota bacterium]
MPHDHAVSRRALLVAVVVALFTGVLASLALRPPGQPVSQQAAADPGSIDVIRWRAASSFTGAMPIIGTTPYRFADTMRAMTGGAIDITVYDPGTVVPALEITESVKDRKVEAGFQWVGYDQGRIPASTLIAAVPFGMEPTEFMAWWYIGGGRELGEELYEPHQVMPILCSITGPETAGWFREPIQDIDDLEGLKIRFAGLGGKVLQRAGASVTIIPGGEIFQALEKGAIDATEFALPVIDQMLGFSQVARYNYFPGWHQPFSTGHLQVNLEIWRGLSETSQAMIRTACQAMVTYSLAEAEALQGAVVRDFQSSGVTTGSLPLPILERLRELAREVLDEEAAADADFAKILTAQREFSATYRYWKTLGYLPRDF